MLLPAGGVWEDTETCVTGEWSSYWSTTYAIDFRARYLYFDAGQLNTILYDYNYYGYSVRRIYFKLLRQTSDLI